MQFRRISKHPARLGECPLWCDETRHLWWVDVLEGALWSWQSETGETERHPILARRLGSIGLCRDNTLILACDDGIYHYDPGTAEQTFLTDPEPGHIGFRKNDGRVDPYGNFWVGTLREQDYAPIGALYRMRLGGRTDTMATGLSIPNALAFDAARKRVYFGDTRAHRIWICDLTPDGPLSERRLFAETEGPSRPDGSCIDADGNLWNAVYAGGRLHQYSPDGDLRQTLALPVSHPTCLAFGGPELKTLFVTCAAEPLSEAERAAEPLAGHVLAIETDIVGRPEYRADFSLQTVRSFAQ